MKVTSDRIKARAEQLRRGGFKLSGSMVRKTLAMNAGARTPLSIKAREEEKTLKDSSKQPENAEAA